MKEKIHKIYLSNLEEYTQTVLFVNSSHIPVSGKRMYSYVRNPRGEGQKPVLDIIYSGKEVVSYLGVFQDKIYLNGQTVSIGWMSSAWTHPEFRRNKLLNSMIQEHYEDYDGYFMITNYAAASEKMFQNSGFFEIFKYLNGHRFYYRLSLFEILPPKSKFFLKLKPILKITDMCGNFFLDLRLPFTKDYSNPNLENAEFDDELGKFISRHTQNSLFKRNIEEFKWILNYPWVKQREEDDEPDKKYYFTTTAKKFYQKALVLKSNKEIKGFLFYSVKNEILKIHYIFTDSESGLEEFTAFILNLIRKEKISYMILTDEKLIQKMKNKGGFIYSKVWKKGFFAGKKLLEDFPEIIEKEIYMGDGDTVFT